LWQTRQHFLNPLQYASNLYRGPGFATTRSRNALFVQTRRECRPASKPNSTKGVAALSWPTPFDEPIPLPDGSQIVTLEDAAKHIQNLPKAEQDLDV